MKKILAFLLGGMLFSSCSERPEDLLISNIETKYANLYVNNSRRKKETLNEMREFFKTHQLNDSNFYLVNKKMHQISDGHLVLIDSRRDKNIRFTSGIKFFPGSDLVKSCFACSPHLPNGKYKIIQVNGISLDQYFEQAKFSVAASTDWGRKYRLSRLLLENKSKADILIKLENHKGKTVLTKLNWEVEKSKTPTCVSGERLGKSFFKINVYSLWCDSQNDGGSSRSEIFENFKNQLDHTLAQATKEDAFIIDLRENGGGGDLEVEYFLNAFFEPSVFVYRYRFLQKTHPGIMKWIKSLWPFKQEVWSPEEFLYTDISKRPKSLFFKNKVITLVSPGCFSSCEGIASVLKNEKRSILIGESTHGGAGEPVIYPLAGSPYALNLPTCVVWQKDGSLIEGHGVHPDVLLAQDVRYLEDNVLKASIDRVR